MKQLVRRLPAHLGPGRKSGWVRVLGCVAAIGGALLAARRSNGDPVDQQAVRAIERRPSPVEEWLRPNLFSSQRALPSGRFATPLVAARFDAWAYAQANADSLRVGSVRKGRVLFGAPTRSRRGCPGGWYAIASGGFACAGGSFRVGPAREAPGTRVMPELASALPYQYVQVITDAAPRYDRLPTPEEERAVLSRGAGTASSRAATSGLLDVRMIGDYFLAVSGEEVDRGRRFYRTLRGKRVRAEDVQVLAPSAMHGVRQPELPIAFVIEDEATLYRPSGEELDPIGRALRFARFPVEQALVRDGERYVVGDRGVAIRAVAVRVARDIERPDAVGPDEKWIHVDLSEQTLVAYEGDSPVFATLVSSGREGHETPTGLYHIQVKHVSATMRGKDPVDGPYEVEEVPWTMYYHRGYALHGAYWHDEFGRVKSHGCTNLPPADARWLVHWTAPSLPRGWHSIRAFTPEGGTAVYFTS